MIPPYLQQTYLQQSLLKGYVSDQLDSKLELLPEFLTNDASENRKVLTTILQALRSCDEFWFSVAFVTTSGVASLMNTLLELQERNIRGRIVASNYLNFTQPLALERLLKNFSSIDLRIVEQGDFHAKGYLFRKGQTYHMIIGSSNLTSSALSKNKEWNLKIVAQEQSYIMRSALHEFQSEFDHATRVTTDWIDAYRAIYDQVQIHTRRLPVAEPKKTINPNLMQAEALANLQKLRNQGERKALLISATGTGKTYLSAFDVAAFRPKRCLFIVHRRNIAKAAMRSFKEVLGRDRSYGLYSGSHRDLKADYLFTTIQTVSRTSHLQQFDPDHFDYIIVDETHRAGAPSYTKVLDHFTPKFLLGMTATPERTDGFDIFSQFDHNIAYEIRLHRAMEEQMLSEFHYYGVQDITADGQIIHEKSDFRYLAADERVRHILETSERYGTDTEPIRGLVFCSRKDECRALSEAFNQRGYKTVALTGDSSEEQRHEAIDRLESDDDDRLEYIFTVDIFNEGVDIPKVNQILMLRPTNSAIIFVQQMGRGLRKVEEKQYVTIIDFIGNYQNNYLIPIALYGDTSYNKDTLRKMISGGSRQIPGSSTINFDRVTKEKIYASIDSANMQIKRDLVKDYDLLLFKLGRHPMMMDFLEHGSRDPFQYVKYSKDSFYAFAAEKEDSLAGLMSSDERALLKYFSKEINNGKRVEESVILRRLITEGECSFELLQREVQTMLGYRVDVKTYESALHNLELKFVVERHQNRLKPVAEIVNLRILRRGDGVLKDTVYPGVTDGTRGGSTDNMHGGTDDMHSTTDDMRGGTVYPGDDLALALQNETFRRYALDSTLYCIQQYRQDFRTEDYVDGFVRYRKYSRKDCFRVLNWEEQPLAQNVGGYMFHPDDENCPIFVNYHKEEDISETTKYEDGFLDTSTLAYMSKSKRKLTSPDVIKFREASERGIRLPLFIKKENAEGDDFYYMGDVTPIPDGFTQTTMGEQNNVSVVKMIFKIDRPVERSMYEYITRDNL